MRNASNALVANAQVGVRVNILQGSASGNAVYSESHMATTNANGLITVNIGGGSLLHGTFADIDWANGPYFLKTDIDPNGGNDYSITSTQQLLSVPYALYAKEAGNVPVVPTNVSAFTNDAGYITAQEIPTIPTVPTNVSAFTNDAGYLTSYTEQQVLSISNDTIFITGGSFVKLPEGFSGSWNDLTDKPENISVPDSVSAFVNDAGYITMDSVPTIPTNVSVFENDAHYITDVQLQQIMSTIFTMQNTIDSMGLVIEALYNQINLPDSTQEMTDTSLQVTFTTTGYTNEPAVHQSDLSGTNFIHNGAGTNGLTGDVNDWWIFVSDRRSPSDYTTYIYANKPVSGFIVKRWSMGEWVDMSSQLYKFSITSNSSSSTITFRYYNEVAEHWEVETSLYAIKFND